MIQSWKARKAKLPDISGRLPGENETLDAIWRGVEHITGQRRPLLAGCGKGEKISGLRPEDKLADLADQAKLLVVDTPDFGQRSAWQVLDHVGPSEEEGYAILYAALIEPFCFWNDCERKDA